jgi:hypothetical protein
VIFAMHVAGLFVETENNPVTPQVRKDARFFGTRTRPWSNGGATEEATYWLRLWRCAGN